MPARPRSARQAEDVIAGALLFLLMLAGGAALFFFSSINPVHTTASAVPSSVDVVDTDKSSSVERLRESVRGAMAAGNIPGLSVAASRNGRVLWSESFGYSDVERRTPATSATRFRIGALSKPLTAAAVLLLHERGRLDPDAPVQSVFPSYPLKAWPISEAHLMSDSGGVHHLRGNRDVMPGGDCATLADAVERFRDEPLAFKPGTAYRFSIDGWILLSAVVEASAREPFEAFMTREVFAPLGMAGTVLEAEGVARATGYFPRAATDPSFGLQDAPDADYSCFAGAGQYLSTASDLARFGGAMVTPGFLRAETLASLLTPVRLESGAAASLSRGWRIEDMTLDGRSLRVLTQRGTPMGATAVVLLVPDAGLAVALTSNVSYAKGLDALAGAVAQAFGST